MTANPVVTDRDGRRGVLEAPPGPVRAALRLDSGERLDVPSDLLTAEPDGSYRLVTSFGTLVGARGEAADVVVPIVEERARVGTRVRETGRVRLTRRVERREETIEASLVRETVEVVHVPVGRFVDAPAAPREEDGVTIIPVYEEVLVVEKRLRLKEELRIVRHRTEERVRQPVELRRTHVDVERVGPDGRATPLHPTEPDAPRAPRFDYLTPHKHPILNQDT